MHERKARGRRWLVTVLIAAAAGSGAMAQDVRDLTSSDPTEDQLIEILKPKAELDDLGDARTIGMAPRPKCRIKTTDGSRNIVLKPISDIAALRVHFAYDSVEILPEAKRILDTLGRALISQTLSASCFQIMGHTDSKGGESYNDRLSRARAEAVARYLIGSFGVVPEQLNTVGFGESKPLTDNSTEEGRKKNRRVEIATVVP